MYFCYDRAEVVRTPFNPLEGVLFMMKHIKKLAICFGGIAVTLLLQGCGEQSYFESASPETEEVAETQTQEAAEPVSEEIVVQVAGCVNNPGVFTLSSDARVYEAIACAGGLLENAYQQDLNQAAKLEDGQMIYVYSMEEHSLSASGSDSAVDADGRVNLNAADEADLMTLPGIGASKAKLIVEYRTEHGNFASPEDIKQIPGIKDGVYNRIKDSIITK